MLIVLFANQQNCLTTLDANKRITSNRKKEKSLGKYCIVQRVLDMPLIVAKSLTFHYAPPILYLFDIHDLFQKYPNMYSQIGLRVRIYVNRIYNEALRIVNEPGIGCLLDVVHEKVGQPSTSRAFLDITDVASKVGIPKNYIVEVLAINFVLRDETGKITESPIFPNEITVEVQDENLRVRVEEEVEALKKLGEGFETVALLYQAGLNDLAHELTDALVRLDKNDFKGMMRSYVKMVESLQVLVKDRIFGTKTLIKELKDFLDQTHSLLSSFEKNYGARALMEEGVFARNLMLATTRYLIDKIKS